MCTKLSSHTAIGQLTSEKHTKKRARRKAFFTSFLFSPLHFYKMHFSDYYLVQKKAKKLRK